MSIQKAEDELRRIQQWRKVSGMSQHDATPTQREQELIDFIATETMKEYDDADRPA
jgi:hypothetical protein